jgi:hypothetical protein
MKISKRKTSVLIILSLILALSMIAFSTIACKKEEQSYAITFATENVEYGAVSGSVTSGDLVKEGTSVTLTAIPEENYAFSGWYAGTQLKSNANPYTFTVSGGLSLTAKFEYTGHVCSYTEHVSYSIDEDLDNDTFVIYRTMKCDCGLTNTAEFTGYTFVQDAYALYTALTSTGQANRLIVLDNGWSYGTLTFGLNHFDQGMTIIGKTGATMSGLTFDSGSGSHNASKYTDIMKSNVTIMGIEFTNDFRIINCSIDGLTISNCTFVSGAGLNIRPNSYDGFDEVNARPAGQRNTVSNTTIENCTFENYANVTNKTKIAAFDIDGITIKNSNISGCDYNAIQLNSRSLDGVYGDIIIEGNTISDTYSRAIRITNIKGNITVKDNTFTYINNSGNDSGQIFKANSQSATTIITFIGNTLNGSAISVNDPKVVWENSVLDN